MQTIKPDDLIVNSLTALIKDAGNQFQVGTRDQKRDMAYIEKRWSHELKGFATKTLPAFGKHLDRCLLNEKFSPFSAFSKQRMSVLPNFLKGLTQKVFAPDGALLGSPDTDVIGFLRQLAFMFYKLEGEYPQELVDECIKDFEECDAGLAVFNPFDVCHYGIAEKASQIMKQIFRGLDVRDLIPRPGPGSSADRKPPHLRFEPHTRYGSIHRRFPYSLYFYANTRHLLARTEMYSNLPTQEHGVSRLTTVPKDSRGPRIICMEPTEFMWLQQGLGRLMMKRMEQNPLSKGQVNFHDQTVNGELALSSSRSGQYHTLDMKEASDRISSLLVEALFDEVPELLSALQALSTKFIELPCGKRIEKLKYAPMGSALCFPVMSAVHFALAVASIEVATGEKRRAIAKKVFVYGDDLIVHHTYTDILLDSFPLFGLKFNPDKCCMSGKFRESCGVDAYDGINVSPQRVKTHTIRNNDPVSIVKAFAVYHGLYNKGFLETAELWQNTIFSQTGRSWPCVSENSGVIGWITPRDQLYIANKGRWKVDPDLQTHKLRALRISTRAVASMSGGWEQLLRQGCLGSRGDAGKPGTPFSISLYDRGSAKIAKTWIPLSAL